MPGATLFLQSNQDIRVGGRQVERQYQYTLQTPDLEQLGRLGPAGARAYLTLPEIADVSSDQQNSGLFVECHYRPRYGFAPGPDRAGGRQRALRCFRAAPGLHHVQIDQPVSRGAGARTAVVAGPDFLDKIYMQTPRGSSVPLSAFSHFTQGITPISLPHQGQFPATTISFNLTEGVSLNDAMLAINKAEAGDRPAANITASSRARRKRFRIRSRNQPILILTALLAVYIVLGILYESLIHPLTIISTLPSAGVGALMAMVLFNRSSHHRA